MYHTNTILTLVAPLPDRPTISIKKYLQAYMPKIVKNQKFQKKLFQNKNIAY